MQTHGEVIEAATVKDHCRANDFLPVPVVQQTNVRAMLVKCEKEANYDEALINKDIKAMHQKTTKDKATHQEQMVVVHSLAWRTGFST